MLTASWTRTALVLITIVFATGVNFATTAVSISNNKDRLDRLEKQIMSNTSKVNGLVVDVEVTKNTVARIEKKLDKVIYAK